MSNAKTLLHQVEKRISPQKYITRYHNTKLRSVGGILENGILPNSAGEIFTTSNPNIWRLRRPVQFRLEIPKEFYTDHSVIDMRDGYSKDWNPLSREKMSILTDYEPISGDPEGLPGWIMKTSDRVYNGGRTSIFNERIPTEYIKEVCFEDDCYDPSNVPLWLK